MNTGKYRYPELSGKAAHGNYFIRKHKIVSYS